jgi:hypothetical protein
VIEGIYLENRHHLNVIVSLNLTALGLLTSYKNIVLYVTFVAAGCGAVIARSSWEREVASLILATLKINIMF